MPNTMAIPIEQNLYDQAKIDAEIEQRSVAGQIEYWAKMGRAALDNPRQPRFAGQYKKLHDNTVADILVCSLLAPTSADCHSLKTMPFPTPR